MASLQASLNCYPRIQIKLSPNFVSVLLGHSNFYAELIIIEAIENSTITHPKILTPIVVTHFGISSQQQTPKQYHQF